MPGRGAPGGLFRRVVLAEARRGFAAGRLGPSSARLRASPTLAPFNRRIAEMPAGRVLRYGPSTPFRWAARQVLTISAATPSRSRFLGKCAGWSGMVRKPGIWPYAGRLTATQAVKGHDLDAFESSAASTPSHRARRLSIAFSATMASPPTGQRGAKAALCRTTRLGLSATPRRPDRHGAKDEARWQELGAALACGGVMMIIAVYASLAPATVGSGTNSS